MSLGIPNDAAFCNLFSTSLELRLHEHNQSPSRGRGSRIGKCCGDHGREHKRRRDERDIYGDQVNRFTAELLAREVTRIGLFEQVNSAVLSQLECDLTVAGVDGDNTTSASLQQTVGESAG